MKPRHVFLILGVALSVFSVVFIMMKGSPKDMVNFNSISEIGEGVLHSVDKVGRIITAVSDEKEMEIGNKIHEKIIAGGMARPSADEAWAKSVEDVGRRIAEGLKRKKIKYKFHIVEADYPNAFASAGGHIYIATGLLKVLKTESELAAILAHEMVHVDAKHAIGMAQYGIAADRMLGVEIDELVDAGYNLFMRPGYSKVQEIEADLGSTYLLYKEGYHPYGIVYAFERTSKEDLKAGYQNTSATPIGDTLGAAVGMIGRYFASHPEALERIDKIKKYIADNKLVGEKARFYVGQKNYDKKVSCVTKRYPGEFRSDYPVIE